MGTSGIGYNAGKVKEVLGDTAPVDSWALVLEEENAKKLSACGITILDDPTDVMAIMLTYMGKDPHKATTADWREAARKLKKSLPMYATSTPPSLSMNWPRVQPVSPSPTPVILSRRRACQGSHQWQRHSGTPFQGRRSGLVRCSGHSSDAPNKEQAYQFINYLSDQKSLPESAIPSFTPMPTRLRPLWSVVCCVIMPVSIRRMK